MSVLPNPGPGQQQWYQPPGVAPQAGLKHPGAPAGAVRGSVLTAPTGQPEQPAPVAGVLVSYTPVAIAQRAAALRSVMVRRIIGLVISTAFVLLLIVTGNLPVGSVWFWVLIVSMVYSVGLTAWAVVQVVWTGKETGKVPMGPAFRIDNQGLMLSTTPLGERVNWSDVTGVKGRMKRFNPGPRLEFAWAGGRVWSVPIIMLDVAPSGIDSALRAHSLGRFGLDLSAVDELW